MEAATTADDTRTDDAKAKVADAADTAKTAAQDAAGQAQEKISDAAGQAKEQAAQAGTKARSRIHDQVDQRSTQAGERAAGTASDLRSVSEQLRSQGKDQPAKLADQAADRIERAGGYLKDNDAERLLHDLEDFGRQRPWAVIAGGLAVGFVASRLLKTSSSDRYATRTGGASGTTSTPPGGYAGGTGYAGASTAPSAFTGGGTGSTPAPASSGYTPPAGRSTGGYAAGDGASGGLGGAPTVTSASAPQPAALDDVSITDALGDVPVSTGPDPLTTTHRERENGTASHGGS